MAVSRINVRHLQEGDIAVLNAGWPELASGYPGLFEGYLVAQAQDARQVFVAEYDGELAGFVTVLWRSKYEPFASAAVPEINNLDVLSSQRRKGVGSALMDAAEALIATRSAVAGIGVGMMASYGPAQVMYIQRGYVPDGHGLTYRDRYVVPGEEVLVGHDLVLWLTKQLREF